jgi:hypothetical protein
MNKDSIDLLNSVDMKEYFIAYFDILGFENMVVQGAKEKGLRFCLLTIINDLNKTLNDTIKLFSNHVNKIDIKKKVFSDNFFLCTEQDYLALLNMIGCMQASLIVKNIFVRGAICHGNLFFHDEFVFGKGLIEAYKIESKISIFPRIVIDNSFFEGAAKIVTRKNQNLMPFDEVCNFLRDDKDYLVDVDDNKFVNYLEIMKRYKDKEPTYVEKMGYDGGLYDFMKILDDHATHIRNHIEAEDRRIKQKYRWCKNYHNIFCRYYQHQDLVI